MRRLGTLAIIFFLFGCASRAPQREAAQLLAIHTTDVQRHLEAFASRRTVLDQERLKNTRRLSAASLEAEDFNARTLAAASEERRKLFEETLVATNASKKRNEVAQAALKDQDARIETTVSLVATRKQQLTAASKVLSRLAQREKPIDTIEFHRNFALSVRAAAKDAAGRQEQNEKAAAFRAALLTIDQREDSPVPGEKP